MGYVEENTLRNFNDYTPFNAKDVVDQIYIGDFETLFKLADGSRIIFDENDNSFIDHMPREVEVNELPDKEWFAEFTRKLKKKLSFRFLTQKELAEGIGVSDVTISRYINGKRYPDIYTLRKIAKYLRCSVSEISEFDYLL